MTARHHILITGTGRSGTTLLMQILTDLGFDTGFRDAYEGIDPGCNGGMEIRLSSKEAPYIVKDPHAVEYLEKCIAVRGMIIDRIIIPMRDLYSAAESRRRIQNAVLPAGHSVPGGLVGTEEGKEQEVVLAIRQYRLMYIAAKYGIPVTFLSFPRMAEDWRYLYEEAIKEIAALCGKPCPEREAYMECHNRLVDISLIHSFQGDRDAA